MGSYGFARGGGVLCKWLFYRSLRWDWGLEIGFVLSKRIATEEAQRTQRRERQELGEDVGHRM